MRAWPASAAALVFALSGCVGGAGDNGAGGGAVRSALAASLGVEYAPGLFLDVVYGEGRSGAPVVVTLHGCCGDRYDLTLLARALAAEGAVVFNASWQTPAAGGSWPQSYQQVGCALGWARAEAARFGGDARRMTMVGWSDGALLGAMVALGGADEGAGAACPGVVPGRAQAVVAVSGFVGWPPVGSDGGAAVPPEQVNPATVAFMGAPPDQRPAAWAGANPWTALGRHPDVDVVLVVGEADPLVGANRCFASAASAAGHRVRLVVADGAGGQTAIAPRTPEGAVTVTEVLRAARGPLPPAPVLPAAADFGCR